MIDRKLLCLYECCAFLWAFAVVHARVAARFTYSLEFFSFLKIEIASSMLKYYFGVLQAAVSAGYIPFYLFIYTLFGRSSHLLIW